MTRTKIIIASTIAFIGGVAFASSMDWTDRLFAQGGAKPRQAEVQSITDASNAFVSISEHVTPAVVSIQAQKDARTARSDARRRQQVPPGFEELFRQFEQQQQQPRTQEQTGSGFIVSRDGYILTNNHVVEGADRVSVAMQDRRVYDAKIIGRDPTTDVAVLKIEGKNFPVLTFGDDERLKIGEWVLAIGNPLGLDFTVTAGIVSAKGRGLPGLNRATYAITDFIQTDAAINPGNSGGPLVNSKGDVIGINSAIASQTGYYAGYGFAIPITLAKQVMDDLIAHGEVRRAVIGVGINEVTPEDAAIAGLKEVAGVKVGGYSSEESPAQKAGIEPGDIIVKADGKPVDRVSGLQRVIRAHKPGDVVDIEAMRYGARKNFKVRLGAAPNEPEAVAAAEPAAAPPAAPSSRLGVSVEALAAEFVTANKIEEQYRGVRVADVDPGSPAHERLFPNDVLVQVLFPEPKVRIRSTSDLAKALERVKAGEYVSFLVYAPGASTRVVNLRTR